MNSTFSYLSNLQHDDKNLKHGQSPARNYNVHLSSVYQQMYRFCIASLTGNSMFITFKILSNKINAFKDLRSPGGDWGAHCSSYL